MNERQYYQINETSFDARTPQNVAEILESARISKERIRIYLGDTKTGRDWKEEFGVIGRVGRSSGIYRVPILLYNRRSNGGGEILTRCIVKIETTRGKRILYQHEKYHIEKGE